MSEHILGSDSPTPSKHSAEAEEKRQPDPAALVAAAMREMAEPKDGIAPTPVWLMLFFFVLAGWSGYYIANNAGAFRSDVYNEHFSQGAVRSKSPRRQIRWCWAGKHSMCACNAIKTRAKDFPALIRRW